MGMGMTPAITPPLLPLKHGDLAFDIGANIGNHAMGMAVLGCRVVALEPNPSTYTELYYRIKRYRQVKCICAACGDKPGKTVIHVTGGDGQGDWIASEYQCNHGCVGQAECKVVTLDELIAKYGKPRAVKIDVEGFEPFVLAGLSQPIEFISFELIKRTPWKTPACMTQLARLGKYEFNFRGWGDHYYLDKWIGPEEFAEWWVVSAGEGDAHARLIQ
jgi:FkbM family methyltransferase